MLLCDAADVVGGKLYILGGGWSRVLTPGQPFNMTLAVKLSVPWDQANRPIKVRAWLENEDGQQVGGETPIAAEGLVEVGRPPGTRPGSSLDAPFVLPFHGVALSPGGYRWQLEVDGATVARSSFEVVQPGG